ncbi:MAG TPA: hypothetical protein VLD58_15110, partial [Gemmatimonadales bacterium]|nr:hypothetical protein [Gemmatimonadales bacterium]
SASDWPYQEREAQMLVAAGLARAGLRDSADRVLKRAETSDKTIDPESELVSTEALIRELMKDREGALRLLGTYLTLHPEHRTGFAQSQSWWWRDLKSDPRFQALVR